MTTLKQNKSLCTKKKLILTFAERSAFNGACIHSTCTVLPHKYANAIYENLSFEKVHTSQRQFEPTVRINLFACIKFFLQKINFYKLLSLPIHLTTEKNVVHAVTYFNNLNLH